MGTIEHPSNDCWHPCPTAGQRPNGRRWWWFLALLLLAGIARAQPPGDELTIEIAPGIDQTRNFDRAGSWTTQWVRRLPPDGAPYVVTSQGPERWLAELKPLTTLEEVTEANRPHLAILRRTLKGAGLLGAGARPALAAATLMGTLRPVEAGGTAIAYQSRVWQLWELLADGRHADSLSASLAVLQGLRDLGIEARLAKYPTLGQGDLYGVLVDDDQDIAAVWGARVGNQVLIPASSQAPPIANLAAGLLTSWSFEEMQNPEWLPQQLENAPDTGPRRAGEEENLDLCTQALALGLECVGTDPVAAQERTYGILSALVLTCLALWIFAHWRRQRRLKERVRQTRHAREERSF